MSADQYVRLFDELGIYECDNSGVDHRIDRPNTGRVMRHPDVDLCSFSLYFNRNGEVGVYFVGIVKDENYFPERLWERIPDHLVKDRDRQAKGGLPIIPRAGREWRAFESLIDSLE